VTSRLFHDPSYFGILVQSGQEVDLRELTNFQPMVGEETYNAVQAMSQKRARVVLHSKRATFYPLRSLVFCGVCKGDIPMRVGKNKGGNGSHVLSYRCDSEGCTRTVKSVRGKYIFNGLYEILDQMKFTSKEYDKYSKTIDGYTDEKVQELRAERRSLDGARKHKNKESEDKARQLTSLPKDTPEIARKTLIHDLEDLENVVIDFTEQIKAINKKIVDPAQIKVTKEEFLNLANSVAEKMRAGTAVEKDMLARILPLNISLDNKNAPSFIWKEPFATLLKSKKILFGAEPAHNFELLSSIADWLFSNKIADAFRLPPLDTESLRLQRLQPSYTY
jgi:hypothetical protein